MKDRDTKDNEDSGKKNRYGYQREDEAYLQDHEGVHRRYTALPYNGEL